MGKNPTRHSERLALLRKLGDNPAETTNAEIGKLSIISPTFTPLRVLNLPSPCPPSPPDQIFVAVGRGEDGGVVVGVVESRALVNPYLTVLTFG